jgi:hypothetical protein
MIRNSWALPLGLASRDWLLGLARAEADAGCPRLFAHKSEIAMYFADVTANWDARRRYDLMCDRVKWLYTGNYGFPSIPMTDQEAAARAAWDYPWFGLKPTRHTPGKPAAEFTWVGGKKEVVDAEKLGFLQRYVRAELGEFKIDKRLLKKATREAMRSCFGKPEGSDHWRHESRAPDLEVTTVLDFAGGHGNQFQYMQWVHLVRGGRRVWLIDHGGLDALLGWPQTIWCYLTNEDIRAAAELLVRVCREFAEAVPEMWERSGLADRPLPDELM